MTEERKSRLKKILDILSDEEEATVSLISNRLNVSSMTIRRDLNELDKRGMLKRLHGGASIVKDETFVESQYILGEQIEKNSFEKSLIGKTAASLIKPKEMIFFDSGSTTPYIAKNVDKNIELNVLCYTLKNAFEFYQRQNCKMILAGGIYDRDSNVFHSKESLEMIKNLRADKAFISAGGIDSSLGLTTYFYFEAEIKKEMIAAAKEVILVVDSSKFGKLSTTFFADLTAVDMIITDNNISQEYKEIIHRLGIKLIIAK